MAFPFFQLLFNSLVIGSIIALVASGFSLVYSVNRFMHIAHGTTVALSGYVLFTLFSILRVPFSISCILTLVFAGLFGYLLHVFYNLFQKKKASNVILLIVSIGLLLLFSNLIQMIFGAEVKLIRLFSIPPTISVFGAKITILEIIIIITSVIFFLLLYLLMHATKLGRNMRAVSDNAELAATVGINAKKMMAISLIIASVLAGIAGILIGLERNLTPNMGTELVVKGFAGAVIGGMTSVPASVVGSYIVGVAEHFGIWWIPSGFKTAIIFGLLFIFLLFRPQGLLVKR